MPDSILAAIVEASNYGVHSETGGGHNQKGIEFQKNWAIVQMLSLEKDGIGDFLFLFEAIHDVSVFDSEHNPSSVWIYQVKKKDRGEWSWSELTKLRMPTNSRISKDTGISDISDSIIGKLHSALAALSCIDAQGRFVSNAGCNLALIDGSNAATSNATHFDLLCTDHRDALISALSNAAGGIGLPPDLARLSVERTAIPVDDPMIYTIGITHDFLLARSREHAGQARALVEALLAKLSPLGSRTNTCRSFEEVKAQHGFSRENLRSALGALVQFPDMDNHLDYCLQQLQSEGLGARKITAIRAAAAGFYRRKLEGALSAEEEMLSTACANLIAGSDDPAQLRPFVEQATETLGRSFPDVRESELQAHFLMRTIDAWVEAETPGQKFADEEL